MSATFEPALIIVGLVLCFFGWTLYWAGLRLMGAVCGAIAAAALVGIILLLTGSEPPYGGLVVGCAIAAVVGALVGVFLIKRAHYLLFFITGAIAGLAVAWLLEPICTEWVQSYVSGAVGRGLYFGLLSLTGGLLVLLTHRIVVIVLTAFGGALLVALGLPSRYAVWFFLPLLLGSLLLQTGILAALGEPGKPEARGEDR